MDAKGARLKVFGGVAVIAAIAVPASGMLIAACGVRSSLSLEELPVAAGAGGLSGEADASISIDASEDGPRCGNGIIEVEAGEQCDRYNLGGATCMSLGEGRGTLRCGPACFFDVSMCEEGEVDSGAYGDGGSRTAGDSRRDGGSSGRSSIF